MKTIQNTQAYETFCRLMAEERLYIDPSISYASVCRALGADPDELDRELEEELGYSGEALIAHFREQFRARLMENYGFSTEE